MAASTSPCSMHTYAASFAMQPLDPVKQLRNLPHLFSLALLERCLQASYGITLLRSCRLSLHGEALQLICKYHDKTMC